jgi:hypothetical protein
MAPDAALEALKTRAADQGGEEAGEIPLPERLERERNILLVWAREEGLTFPAKAYLSYELTTHGEHHVFYEIILERYFKVTHGLNPDAGGFALTVDTDFRVGKKTQCYIGVPFVREATPFEYLSRLQLFNRTFTDFIDFAGVIDEPGKVAIVTSQPFVPGEASTDEEVAAFMATRGFGVVPGVVAGRRDSVSFFRERDNVAVFDTHGENFLTFGPKIAPIDALIIVADDDLAAFLSLAPAKRREEIGIWTSLISDF